MVTLALACLRGLAFVTKGDLTGSISLLSLAIFVNDSFYGAICIDILTLAD